MRAFYTVQTLPATAGQVEKTPALAGQLLELRFRVNQGVGVDDRSVDLVPMGVAGHIGDAGRIHRHTPSKSSPFPPTPGVIGSELEGELVLPATYAAPLESMVSAAGWSARAPPRSWSTGRG